MAESQLAKVWNVLNIIQDRGLINDEEQGRLSTAVTTEIFIGIKRMLVEGGVCSLEDYDSAVLENAKLTVAAAQQDILTILDADLFENMELLASQWGKEGAINHKKLIRQLNPTIADAAAAVAEIAKRIVILVDENRTGTDATEAQTAVKRAQELVAYLAGDYTMMTTSTADRMVNDVLAGFGDVALANNIEYEIVTDYIDDRGADIRGGLEKVAELRKQTLGTSPA